ncbi:WD40/YVTN/BNR-like repeat-containing protein [Parasediminibacterium sp. JCM 36343]|uniref:WD40/YVTN/BNR-like repeat-containing protein n=1 Tax=Parasediminibacterium sp. JCM 36343 TaxID=3374279 RepID=UPI00397AE005
MNVINYIAFLVLFQSSFGFDQSLKFLQASPIQDSQRTQKRDKNATANIIFKSTDGGKTWQDIGKGLPKNMQGEGYQVDSYVYKAEDFANYNGLYLRSGKWIYHIEQNPTTPVWKKEIFPDKMSNIAPANKGIFAYNYGGQILQKTNGTNVWSPVFTSFKGKVRTVFETAGGTVFIGSENGLFKSTNGGKTWKHVHVGGWVLKLVEQNGVLLATSMTGIIRSTDDGENWAVVISEGGVGIAVENIKGGFAAITFNTLWNTRRVSTSYDGGKTWQAIDAGLPGSLSIASIIQVGENLFCGHPDGIYQSSNKGKTWKRILCPMDGKVFNLSVSGNVMYAILKNGGC